MKADPPCDQPSGSNPVIVVWCEEAISAPHRHSDAIQHELVVWRARASVQLRQDDRGQPDQTRLQRSVQRRPSLRSSHRFEQRTCVRNLRPCHARLGSVRLELYLVRQPAEHIVKTTLLVQLANGCHDLIGHEREIDCLTYRL
jgi:hypothetical protein